MVVSLLIFAENDVEHSYRISSQPLSLSLSQCIAIIQVSSDSLFFLSSLHVRSLLISFGALFFTNHRLPLVKIFDFCFALVSLLTVHLKMCFYVLLIFVARLSLGLIWHNTHSQCLCIKTGRFLHFSVGFSLTLRHSDSNFSATFSIFIEPHVSRFALPKSSRFPLYTYP